MARLGRRQPTNVVYSDNLTAPAAADIDVAVGVAAGTGAAIAPSKSVKPNVGIAAGTGAAIAPSVSGGTSAAGPSQPLALSSIQLLELDGVSARGESVRFDLLDQAGEKIGELHPAKSSVPSIQNDSTRAIKRTLQNLLILRNEEPLVDTITHKLRPMWILADGSEWPLGVFMWGDASRLRYSSGLDMQATLVDQSFMIDQKIDTSVSYQPGDRIDVALAEQATLAGIIDPDITSTSATIGATGATWPADTSRLKVMTDLCGLAGFFDPYFDNAGTLICRPAMDPASVDITLTYEEGGRIIPADITESDDLLSAPNRYRATSNAATDAEVFAVFDIPDDAPNSIKNRGFVIAEKVTLSALDNNAAALAAAQARYAQGKTAFRWVEFDAVADPRHDTYDVIGYLGDTYRETSWSLNLTTGGLMHHSLRRVY